MNEMVVNKRDIRTAATFSPLVNLQVPYKISKIVGISQTFGKI